MSGSIFSQKNSPQWIQSPSGDTLLGFNSAHVDILGEKLILKSYLVQRNYELVQINDLMTQRCNALSSALEDRMEEVAKIDDELRLTTMRLQTLNLQIEDQEKKIKTLRRIIILQKTIIIIESAALLVAGTLIVLNTKD